MSAALDDAVEEIIRVAWATRRQALSAPETEKETLLLKAKALLEGATSNTPTLQAQCLHKLANVEMDLGNTERAETLWSEAVGLLRTVDAPLELAHKVRHLGDLFYGQKRIADAETCYNESLALYRAHGKRETALDFANALIRLAQIQEDKALDLWRAARTMYAQVHLDAGIDMTQSHIDALSREDLPRAL